jgi:microcystin-dependent protein
MSEPFISEIRVAGFNFAPPGWLPCDGRLLRIPEYDALFTLLGTTYGGDGVDTFALPDLRGRFPVHQGQGAGLSVRTRGEQGGSESVVLTTEELPLHQHVMAGSGAVATEQSPEAHVTGHTERNIYGDLPPYVPLSSRVVAPAGASQPHDNMHPFQVVYFIIATEGLYPPRS